MNCSGLGCHAVLVAIASLQSPIEALGQGDVHNDANRKCTELAQADFSTIQDTPAQITKASVVVPADGVAGICSRGRLHLMRLRLRVRYTSTRL